jgi:hypothetical protein
LLHFARIPLFVKAVCQALAHVASWPSDEMELFGRKAWKTFTYGIGPSVPSTTVLTVFAGG